MSAVISPPAEQSMESFKLYYWDSAHVKDLSLIYLQNLHNIYYITAWNWPLINVSPFYDNAMADSLQLLAVYNSIYEQNIHK